MPTSFHGYITDVITHVRKINPKSILDIGVGFGKWGHLFREYLDVMNGRPFKKDWQVEIVGVEIFEKYITRHQRSVYSKIVIGDMCDMGIPHYDLIFMSDVLEHIEKKKALELVEYLKQQSDKFILILPMGEKWLGSQGGMYGNPNEAHISQWEEEDIVGYDFKKTYTCNKKPINLYIF